jgi:hypothetical protein
MPYANGGAPMCGDRIGEKKDRVGTVTRVSDFGIFTVSWDDGVVGINYTVIERFTLISRASESPRQ